MMASGNVGGPGSYVKEDLFAGMAAFDRLPRALRERLNYATVNFSPLSATAQLSMYRRKPFRMPLRDAVECVIENIEATERTNAVADDRGAA